jgi:hypothetical protein
VGDTSFIVSELLADALQIDPITRMYGNDGDGKHLMKRVPAAIVDGEGDAVGGNSRSGDYVQVCPSRCHVPCYILMRTRKTKYRPYDALRQFWRQYLKQ